MTTIACPCPPKADGGLRHPNGDEVTLRERLDFRSATTIRKAIGLAYLEDPDTSMADVLGLLTEQYLLFGIESWTLRDEKNKPIPATRPEIRARLMAGADIQELADAADNRFGRQVMLPLMAAAQTSSRPGPTDGLTSARTGSGPRRQRRSKPSSTSTTPTAAIATITSLPVGDSSSSRSAKSAP